MDTLGKISLAVTIIGMISLFFIYRNFNLDLNGINNITTENIDKTVRLQGKILDYKEYNNSFVITLESNCKIDAFYYNKKGFPNLNKSIGKNIKISGIVQKDFGSEIMLESLDFLN